MTPTRLLWRWLAAIVLIAAVVLPPAAHAHAGHEHGVVQVVAAALADHADRRAVEPGENPVEAHPHAACCAACGCHASLAEPAPAPTTRVWRAARLVPLASDAGHPSLAPETLPRPPRSFA